MFFTSGWAVGSQHGRNVVIRTVLAAGALVLGLAASPTAIRVADNWW
jgi:hypothetical protein